MDKLPVGQLPDLASSNNDDEIMVITNSEYSQLKKEKISDFITDLTSTDENNAIVKGADGKLFTKDFGNASNITEGTLPVSVLPDIPKDKLPEIETDDLPDSGITAGTYTYPTDIVVNSKGQVTSITEGQAGANNANQDLSNLSPEGEKHFINKTQITNCLLEIPQDINIELSDGVLTLKAGSVVYVPNGVNNFDKLTISNDLSMSLVTGTTDYFVFVAANGLALQNRVVKSSLSGSSDPNTGGTTYYNTTNNKIISHNTTGDVQVSFPIARITVSNSVITSISQVFNGIGYIGKTLFALPNVKGLIPNGRNADGTLNNTELTLSKPITYTRTDTLTGSYGLLISSVRINATSAEYNYTKNLNILPSSGAIINGILIGSVTHTNGNVTSIKVDEPFTAVDYNDFLNTLNKTQITNCILEAPNGVATYSGSTITIKSGLKALMPNGKNADGTLNNIEYTLKTDRTLTHISLPTGQLYLFLVSSDNIADEILTAFVSEVKLQNETPPEVDYTMWYSPSTNIWKRYFTSTGWVTYNACIVAIHTANNGIITSLTPYQPFRAIDYNYYLYNGISNVICTTAPTTASTASAQRPAVVVENYVNGTSGYFVRSDGYCEQWGYVLSVNRTTTITLLKKMIDTNYSITCTGTEATGGKDNGSMNAYNPTTTEFNIYNTSDNVSNCYWKATGYIS